MTAFAAVIPRSVLSFFIQEYQLDRDARECCRRLHMKLVLPVLHLRAPQALTELIELEFHTSFKAGDTAVFRRDTVTCHFHCVAPHPSFELGGFCDASTLAHTGTEPPPRGRLRARARRVPPWSPPVRDESGTEVHQTFRIHGQGHPLKLLGGGCLSLEETGKNCSAAPAPFQ